MNGTNFLCLASVHHQKSNLNLVFLSGENFHLDVPRNGPKMLSPNCVLLGCFNGQLGVTISNQLVTGNYPFQSKRDLSKDKGYSMRNLERKWLILNWIECCCFSVGEICKGFTTIGVMESI